MEFYTAGKTPRPVRLNDDIRMWAWESQHGKYGDEAMANYAVAMDDIPGYGDLPPIVKQDMAIRRIAERAPLRICPGEKVSGAATLGLAIHHAIPITYMGKPVLAGVSHHTPNFTRVIREGMDSYAAQLEKRLKCDTLTENGRIFIKSLINVVDSLRIWHARYLEAAPAETAALLRQVPFKPARSFREALQCLWFMFAFMRVCGNWPGIGRIDVLLGDYLENDLAAGRITMEEAREALASMFIKGCEWIQANTPVGSGDAQHYQNIVLAGIDESGREVTNAVTYLVLDIVEELAISDFPITVRINENTPEKLLRRVAEVMRHGGGTIAVYNEPLILAALDKAGYPLSDARRFANDGCWEVQIPGETSFAYLFFDALQLLSDTLGLYDDGAAPDYPDYNSLYQAFLKKLNGQIDDLHRSCVTEAYSMGPDGWTHVHTIPCSVVSLFTDGCIDNARCYFDLGPNYTVRSPHIGGAVDVGNSLMAIDRIVYKEKRMTLSEMIAALRADWKDMDAVRLSIRNKLTYYGNDDDTADAYTARLLNDFAALTAAHKSDIPVKFVPGASTFGRQIDWLPKRTATAFGARKGEILSGNNSPTPGTDVSGATAIIRSYCKPDLTLQTTGAALDIKLYPETVDGKNGVEALMALIQGFLSLGGYFMQLDVVDAKMLLAAQENPSAFKTLSVRVSGWNARFITLDKEWQNMIIERTAQHV